MTNTNQAAEYAETLADSLASMWAAIDHMDDCPDGDPEACAECAAICEYGDDRDAVTQYLDDMPLEIVWEMGERFAILLTFGGPNAWIHGGGREGGYTLDVYWGGEQATNRSAAITRTGDYFREQVES